MRKQAEPRVIVNVDPPPDRYAALRPEVMALVVSLNNPTIKVRQEPGGGIYINQNPPQGKHSFNIDIRMPGSIEDHTWESEIWMSGFVNSDITPVINLINRHVDE